MSRLASRRLIDAFATLGAADRALVNIWVNRGLDDAALARMTRISEETIAERRGRIVEHLSSVLGLPPEDVSSALTEIAVSREIHPAAAADAPATGGDTPAVEASELAGARPGPNGGASPELVAPSANGVPPPELITPSANGPAPTELTNGPAPPELITPSANGPAPTELVTPTNGPAPPSLGGTPDTDASTAAAPEIDAAAPAAPAEADTAAATPVEADTDAPAAAAPAEAETAAAVPIEADTVAPAPVAPAEADTGSSSRRRGWLWGALALFVIVVVAVVLVVSLASGGSGRHRRPAPHPAAAATQTVPPTSTTTPASTTTPSPSPPVSHLPGVDPLVALAGDQDHATGTVRTIGKGQHLKLYLTVSNLPAASHGHYEMWLYDSLIYAEPLGRLRTGVTHVSLRLPGNADRFRWIDISLQPPGQVFNSGESMLRSANPVFRKAKARHS